MAELELNEVLERSARTGEILKIRYLSGKKGSDVREISVYNYIPPYIWAYCIHSKRIKQFIIDKINLVADDEPTTYNLKEKPQIKKTERSESITDRDYIENGSKLLNAMANKKAVRIRYKTGDNAGVEYDIIPHWRHEYFFKAYCFNTAKEIIFSVQQIEIISELQECLDDIVLRYAIGKRRISVRRKDEENEEGSELVFPHSFDGECVYVSYCNKTKKEPKEFQIDLFTINSKYDKGVNEYLKDKGEEIPKIIPSLRVMDYVINKNYKITKENETSNDKKKPLKLSLEDKEGNVYSVIPNKYENGILSGMCESAKYVESKKITWSDYEAVSYQERIGDFIYSSLEDVFCDFRETWKSKGCEMDIYFSTRKGTKGDWGVEFISLYHIDNETETPDISISYRPYDKKNDVEFMQNQNWLVRIHGVGCPILYDSLESAINDFLLFCNCIM